MSKKDFKAENPATATLAFLSSQPAEAEPKEETPRRYKVNPEYIEVKSKRVQIVLRPSLYDKAKAEAKLQGVSFNEFVHKALEQALERK